MSGIVGVVNLDGAPVDRDLLRRMTDFMAYRGPDVQEIWTDGPVGFGHAMLRTTWEAETERQPLSLDGTVCLAADARIDGRADLIAKLEAKGRADAKRANDAELILHAYHAWGEDCVSHLIGDFAFAIWDGRSRRLFCARDHLGVKPFYYAHRGRCFVFGNTLNCIRLHASVPGDLNELAIADYLLFGENQDFSSTTYQSIGRLPAAHRLTLSVEGPRLGKYWALPADFHFQYAERPPEEVAEGFREVLASAVKDRLRADRVAVEMSGGLDSTSVAATARALMPGDPSAIRACCVSYARLIPDREKYYAELVGAALGISVDHVIADDLPLFPIGPPKAVPPDPMHMDAFASSVSRSLLARLASHSRVVLTGWDGDMLMSESPRHYFGHLLGAGDLRSLARAAAWYVRSQRRLPPVGLRTSLKRLLGQYPRKSAYPCWLEPSFEARLALRQRWKEVNAEPPKAHPTRPHAFRLLSLPNFSRLLESYDPGLTGFPLEARHPIVDIRVIEYLLRVPPVPWCVNKQIVRVAMRGRLPAEVLSRPKCPLAGDPAVVQIRERATRPLDEFRPGPELGSYVRRAAIPAIAGEGDSEALWMNVRPFTLNSWLEAQEAIR